MLDPPPHPPGAKLRLKDPQHPRAWPIAYRVNAWPKLKALTQDVGAMNPGGSTPGQTKAFDSVLGTKTVGQPLGQGEGFPGYSLCPPRVT